MDFHAGYLIFWINKIVFGQQIYRQMIHIAAFR